MLLERATKRGRDRERDLFHLLVYSLNACSSQGQARLKKSQEFHFFHQSGRIQALGLSSAASQAYWQKLGLELLKSIDQKQAPPERGACISSESFNTLPQWSPLAIARKPQSNSTRSISQAAYRRLCVLVNIDTKGMRF